MNQKNRALLLSGLVLPGLGQLYIGRKISGVVIIMLVNLLLLLALFVLFKGLNPLIAARLTSSTVSPEEIIIGLKSVAGLGKALLAGLILVWGYSIIDLVRLRDDA